MNPEELLIHSDFIRSLARSLVRDQNTADDISQQTWLAAVKSPPSENINIRNWLSKVAVNFTRIIYRSDKKRDIRERAAARPELMPSPDEIASREETRRILVNAVLSLTEPFRTAVFLRYYENLSAKEVAKRTGVPLSTARSQIQRGLEKVRLRLDSIHGGNRASWTLALAPFAGLKMATAHGASAATCLLQGLLAMTSSMKVNIGAALSMIAVLAAVYFVVFDNLEDGTLSLLSDQGSQGVAIDDDAMSGEAQLIPNNISKETGRDVGEKIALISDKYAPDISGKVIDQKTRKPVGGVFVVAMGIKEDGSYSYDSSMNTDDLGCFTLTNLQRMKYRITACHSDFEERYYEAMPGAKGIVIPLFKEDSFSIYGAVYNDQGAIMPGVEITVSGPCPVSLSENAISDENGRYRIDFLPPCKLKVSAGEPKITDRSRIRRVSVFEKDSNGKFNSRTVYLDPIIPVSLNENSPGAFTYESVDVEIKDRDIELNFGLVEKNITWRGGLFDWNGDPLPFGVIEILNLESNRVRQIRCDQKGRFQVNKVLPGAYRIFIDIGGSLKSFNFRSMEAFSIYKKRVNYRYEWNSLLFNRPGVVNKDIRLHGGEISGKVFVSKTDKPAKYSAVKAVHDSPPHRIFHSITNADGRFSFLGLPKGSYSIFITGFPNITSESGYNSWDCSALDFPIYLDENKAINDLTIYRPVCSQLTLQLIGFPDEVSGWLDSTFDESGIFYVKVEDMETGRSVTHGPEQMTTKGEWSTYYTLPLGTWRFTIQGERIGLIERVVPISTKRGLVLSFSGKKEEK